MKIILIVLAVLLTTGCGTPSAEEKARTKAYAEIRHGLFVECMKLAAKMERQSDDDVHKIISKCSSVAYYMAEMY